MQELGGRGRRIRAVLLRGLVFKLLNIRKTTSKEKEIHCVATVSVIALRQVQRGSGDRAPVLGFVFAPDSGIFFFLDEWLTRPAKNCPSPCASSSSPAKPESQIVCLCLVSLAMSHRKHCKKRPHLQQVTNTTGKNLQSLSGVNILTRMQGG